MFSRMWRQSSEARALGHLQAATVGNRAKRRNTRRSDTDILDRGMTLTRLDRELAAQNLPAPKISQEVGRDPPTPAVKVPRQASVEAEGSELVTRGVADAGIQCTLVPLPPLGSTDQPMPLEEAGCAGPSAVVPHQPDSPGSPMQHDSPDYTPSDKPSDESSDQSSHGDNDNPPRKPTQASEEQFFLVQESCLLSLFKSCTECGGQVDPRITRITGSMIQVSQRCRDCEGCTSWSSQTLVSGTPLGNLAISAGILFTGSRPFKALRIFETIKCPVPSVSTYIRHQRNWLHPVIEHVWSSKQREMLQSLKEIGMPLNVGGDARSDSPGHSAKYGSYTFLDLDWNMILHQELIQSNEVSSSNAMELEGLKRGLQFLSGQGLTIDSLVTDRHRSVAKYMREEQQDVSHYYDVWHIAKGISKKLQQLAKKKTCRDVAGWTKSISNHLYWVAASSRDDTEEVVLAKWLSVANHIQNQHTHDTEQFPKCLHEELPTTGRKKKWLKPNTEACEKTVEIITNISVQRDIKKLSPIHQTSSVEGFHALVIHFAPKMTHFSYRGMRSRLHLAALHYNENGNRGPAKRKDGTERYNLRFPKAKKGEVTVVKLRDAATYGYVRDLMACLIDFCQRGTLGENLPVIQEPPPLAASYVHPDKEAAIEAHQSRFQDD